MAEKSLRGLSDLLPNPSMAAILTPGVDLSGWDMKSATDLEYMFQYAQFNSRVKVSDWNFGTNNPALNHMFTN